MYMKTHIVETSQIVVVAVVIIITVIIETRERQAAH